MQKKTSHTQNKTAEIVKQHPSSLNVKYLCNCNDCLTVCKLPARIQQVLSHWSAAQCHPEGMRSLHACLRAWEALMCHRRPGHVCRAALMKDTMDLLNTFTLQSSRCRDIWLSKNTFYNFCYFYLLSNYLTTEHVSKKVYICMNSFYYYCKSFLYWYRTMCTLLRLIFI